MQHCFTVHLLNKVIDIGMIQKLLFHNDIRTTLRYLHTSHKDLLDVVSPIDHLNIVIPKPLPGKKLIVNRRNVQQFFGSFFIFL